jgi:hypothetical protein
VACGRDDGLDAEARGRSHDGADVVRVRDLVERQTSARSLSVSRLGPASGSDSR